MMQHAWAGSLPRPPKTLFQLLTTVAVANLT